jgi:multidrug efflux pump subunit AcrA (membrane-fusion protein)
MLNTPLTATPGNRRRRRWMSVAAVALGLVVLAITVAARASTGSTTALRTATVGRGDVTQTLDQVASVEPVVQASVAFPIAGTVAEVSVDVGDAVDTGDSLASLDTTSLLATLHEKEASLDSAELTLERAENGESTNGAIGQTDSGGSGSATAPRQSGSSGAGALPSSDDGADTNDAVASTTTTTISSEQLASYRAAIDAAEAGLAAAQQDVAQATISSPIDGVVLAVTLEPGASVSAGSTTAYVLIAGAGGYELTTKVSVDDLPDVKVGQPATIAIDGQSGTLAGHVSGIAVAPDTDDTTRYTVIIAIDGGASGLRNGATASVQIVTKHAADVVTVPTSAVHVDGTRRTVTIVDRDETSEKVVETGAVGPTLTEITSGIDVGDIVVLADLDHPLPSSATQSSNASTVGAGGGRLTGGFGPPSGGGLPR